VQGHDGSFTLGGELQRNPCTGITVDLLLTAKGREGREGREGKAMNALLAAFRGALRDATRLGVMPEELLQHFIP
jgi:hypothetical protein